MRGRRIAAYTGLGLAAVVLLLLVVVLVLTQTDWGREQFRRFALDRARGAIDGHLEVGRIEGNLLRGIVLIDLSITDAQGRPFVTADTLATRFSLRSLFSRRIALTDVRAVHPHVVLDKPPGEEWNYARIFRIDPDVVEPRPPGWGDWIALEDVTLVDGRVDVQAAWRPSPELSPAERQEAVREALAGEKRDRIVAVNGGFQNLMEFRDLNAELTRIVAAHPDTAGIPIEIAAFSGIAQPFQPPAAEVLGLSGGVRIARDTLFFGGIDARLPESRLRDVEGAYALDTGELFLRLEGAPLAFDDMRWIYPPLPEEGGGAMQLTIEIKENRTRIIAAELDVAVRDATITGRFDLLVGDTLRFGETDLDFARVPTGFVERFIPDFEFPRPGRLGGRLALTGPPAAMRLDGDVRFDDDAGPVSRILANGELGLGDVTRFRQLDLRFAPLHPGLARAVLPDVPLDGPVEGRMRLTGTLPGALQLDADLTLRDPRTGLSRVRAIGGVDTRDELQLRNLLVRADPLRLDFVRRWAPWLPPGATATGQARLTGVPTRALHVDGDLVIDDPGSGRSGIGATGRLVFNDDVRADDLLVRADALQVELLRRWAPGLPPGGTLTGAVRLDGVPARAVHVDGRLAHEHAVHGTSRIAATGGIAMEPSLRFSGLDVTMEPLQMSLVRAFGADIPVGGILTGNALLDGAPDARLAVRGDVVHLEAGERSHVTGRAEIATGPGGHAAVDVTLQPLSLAVAGRFVPGAGLHGSVSGTLQAVGDLEDVRLSADLRVAGGGAIAASGTLDLGGAQPAYDVAARLRDFNLAALTWRAPAATDLTGTVSARGRGLEPATMQARIDADLVDSEVDAVRADMVRLRLALDAGLAHVDSSVIRLGAAEALLDGSFGLVEHRSGTLAFNIAVDTLDAFAAWLPEVTDVPDELRADRIAGLLRAAGSLRGNVHRFDAGGRAVMQDFRYDDLFVGAGNVEFVAAGIGTPEPDVQLDARLDDVRAGGVAFESFEARGRYAGTRYGTGEAVIIARVDDDTEYRADAAFTLALERSELRISDLALRFDTINWRTTAPTTIAWGQPGIEVEALEMVSDAGGRIFLDGRLPVDGPGALDVALEDVEIAQIAALLQREHDVTGRLDLVARVEGTPASPRMGGTASLTDARLDGDELPHVRATFEYANQELSANAELTQDGRDLAVAEARLPIALTLTGAAPRLLPGPIAVDVRADSLHMETIPGFRDEIDRLDGFIRGDIVVRGTFEDPEVTGDVHIDFASLRIVATDVTYTDVSGRIRFDGSVAQVDSLVLHNGGPIVVSGSIGLPTMAEPELALTVTARDALVYDRDDSELRVDADVEIGGTLALIEVTGDVRTRRGVIYVPPLQEIGDSEVVSLHAPPNLERLDPELQTELTELERPSPLMRRLRLDLALTIDRDVWLRSTEANVEIYTPPEVGPLQVRMDGPSGDRSLLGTISTDRGEYEFMSRRFDLTRGGLTFLGDGELNPIIQVAAEHEVRMPGREAFAIRVLLGGTVRNLEITLESTSQPPISQTDLLTYLAFGRDAASLLQQGTTLSGQGSGTGALVGNVAGMATQQLATIALETVVNDLERDLMRGLRLDVFRITPADLPPELFTGDYADLIRGTEIEGGRYIRPGLFVAGQIGGGLVRPGIRVIYHGPLGVEWRTSWRPRFLATEPTLEEREPERASVLGSFLFREWRF